MTFQWGTVFGVFLVQILAIRTRALFSFFYCRVPISNGLVPLEPHSTVNTWSFLSRTNEVVTGCETKSRATWKTCSPVNAIPTPNISSHSPLRTLECRALPALFAPGMLVDCQKLSQTDQTLCKTFISSFVCGLEAAVDNWRSSTQTLLNGCLPQFMPKFDEVSLTWNVQVIFFIIIAMPNSFHANNYRRYIGTNFLLYLI